MSNAAGLQPFVNQQTLVLAAPTQVWSAADGDLGENAIDGVFHADWRYLKTLRLLVNGNSLEGAGSWAAGSRLMAHGLVRSIDDPTPDPRILVRREREVSPGQVAERVTIHNGLTESVEAPVELLLDIDFSELMAVKAGISDSAAITVEWNGDTVSATDGVRTLDIVVQGAKVEVSGATVRISDVLHIPGGASAGLSLELTLHDPTSVISAGKSVWRDLPVSGLPRLDRWATRAIEDCKALLLDAGQGAFPAAGAPWFLTLFGRDSLITARFLLPVSVELAHTTLRTLAARQGQKGDLATAEQPGKILHEVRAGVVEMPGEGISLPPVYYGTIDATGLWVILLHEAWRAGLAREHVEELLPTLQGCLEWLTTHGVPDDSGYLKYIDESGHGLANQGWKDSGDSIRFHDGRIAQGPIALAEVQAQACLAAEYGAELLTEFGQDSTSWRAWAQEMRDRFRRDFWVERDGIRFPAIALDGQGQQVDSMTSNMGQLLGTTLLNTEEEQLVADLLIQPHFASGFGLRTMSTMEGGYWPLSYHCGTVWTHDTAVAIEGMLRSGLIEQAKILAEQLIRAAELFEYRMPELFAGFAIEEAATPVAYPASCRPQAWSAAAVVPVYRTLSEVQI